MAKKGKNSFFNIFALTFIFTLLLSLLRGGSFIISMFAAIIGSLFALVCLSTITFIHELGHLIAGTIVGYKLMSYRVGSTSFDLMNGKFKKSKKNSKGYIGLTSMVVTSESLSKYTFYISGGVLLNIITGIIALIISPSSTLGMLSASLFGILSITMAIDENDIQTLVYCCDNFESNSTKIASYTAETIDPLICYTSCITNNFDKAKEYYNKIEPMLKKDESCSGCRIRAYYEFYINEDLESASVLCEQGINVVDEHILKGYAIMERDLLVKLQNQINDILSYA